MLHEVRNLIGYTVHASDGNIGEVHDLFFDDKDWSARYLMIATNDSLEERELLVSMDAIKRIDVDQKEFHLNASRHELQTGVQRSKSEVYSEYKEQNDSGMNEVDEALEETFPASDPASTY